MAALCAIACTSSKTTIYDFSAETNSGDQMNFSNSSLTARGASWRVLNLSLLRSR